MNPHFSQRKATRRDQSRQVAEYMFCKETMTPTRGKLRLTLWLGTLLGAFFLGTALVGMLREQRDEKVIQEKYNRIAKNLQTKMEQVGEGVPRETFTKILPNAYFDTRDNEWVVIVPTRYSESPACTNTVFETKHFRNEGDRVVPIRNKDCAVFSHGDRFGIGGIWYYFWRAWYSSVQSEGEP